MAAQLVEMQMTNIFRFISSMVEAETKELWTWILRLLLDAI